MQAEKEEGGVEGQKRKGKMIVKDKRDDFYRIFIEYLK